MTRIDLPKLIEDRSEEISLIPEKKYSRWAVLPNHTYAPSYPVIQALPAGLYEISWNNSMASHVMTRKSISTDELLFLPGEEMTQILDDITKFWERRQTYLEYKFSHKRGILLYGQPGCGKSGIIQLCINHLITTQNGIVINVTDSNSLEFYIDFVENIRQIEPDRPIIVLLEDLDALAGESHHNTSMLLNVLDGIKQIDNVVYIATTNYPEKLEERITNRPSRFDVRFEIPLPDESIRKCFIEAKVKEKDIDVDLWVKSTEGLSLAHVKELIISIMVLGNTFEDSISRIKGLKIKPKRSSPKIGF